MLRVTDPRSDFYDGHVESPTLPFFANTSDDA